MALRDFADIAKLGQFGASLFVFFAFRKIKYAGGNGEQQGGLLVRTFLTEIRLRAARAIKLAAALQTFAVRLFRAVWYRVV